MKPVAKIVILLLSNLSNLSNLTNIVTREFLEGVQIRNQSFQTSINSDDEMNKL